MTISPLSGIGKPYGISGSTSGVSKTGGISAPPDFVPPPVNMYEALFTSLGAKGLVLDGIDSVKLVAAGGAVAGNGDPIGSYSDISGNGNNVLQATGGSKPVLSITNGVGAIADGTGKYLHATLPSALACPEFDVTIVYYIPPSYTGDGLYPYVFDGDSYDYYVLAATGTVFVVDAANYAATNSAPYSGMRILHTTWKVDVIPGFDVSAAVYTPSGTTVDANTTLNGSPAADSTGTSLNILFPITTNTAGAEIAFMMISDKAIIGADWTAVKADLIARFGAWK